jgi:hypothetical protein
MDKLSLNVILLSHVVGIAKTSQGSTNQNNILLNYNIIHICIDLTT